MANEPNHLMQITHSQLEMLDKWLDRLAEMATGGDDPVEPDEVEDDLAVLDDIRAIVKQKLGK